MAQRHGENLSKHHNINSTASTIEARKLSQHIIAVHILEHPLAPEHIEELRREDICLRFPVTKDHRLGYTIRGYTKLYMHLGFLGLEHWNIGTLRSRLRKKNTQWTRTDAADVPIDPAVMGISTDPADASGCVELKESLLKLLLDSSNILIILIYLDISWFSMIVALQSTTTSNEEHFFRRQGKIVLWLANFSVLGKEWDPCTGTGWSKLSGLDAVFFFQKVDPTTPGPRQGRITVVEEDTHKQR